MLWISVLDRCPPDMEPVLAAVNGRVYAMQFYSGTDDDPAEWMCAQGDGYGVPRTGVTHWMPMPAAPVSG